ncbi:transporter substrate-binding domain-containing protein [Peptoniphilus raoultii]|uniref:transporter substrate-binding domain-containing protein n=1 Tax=Peptoniphilus raoultii TaxID=1776387 RepID=UPI0008D9B7F9|nr:transporter substrate-binding domain-containing protein [Peptoniphilus raoultii]
MKKLFKFVTFVFILLSLCACSKTEEKADEDVLKVGMECGYAPFNWTQIDDSNGAVGILDAEGQFAGGYDVYMAQKVADALGKKLVIVKTEWDGLPPALKSGKIDLIMAGMSPTPDRAKEVQFTNAYWKSEYVMIVKRGSVYENAKSLDDFKGAKITAQLNTVHYDIIDQINGVEKMEAQSSFPELRVALQSGVIDGYVAEVPEAKSVESATDDLVSVSFDEGKGFTVTDNSNEVACAVKIGNDELLKKVNEVFDGISEEQRLEIMDKAIESQPANE